MGQGDADQGALEFAGEVVEDAGFAAHQAGLGGARQRRGPVERGVARFLVRLGRQILGFDELAGRHHGEPVAEVFQLPDVAGIGQGGDRLHRVFRNLFDFDAEFLRALLEEMPHQQRDVLAPFA